MADSQPTAPNPSGATGRIIDAIDKLSYARKGLELLIDATENEGAIDNDHIAWCVDHVLAGLDEARTSLDRELDERRAAGD